MDYLSFSLNLNEIKRFLISRDLKKQIHAVRTILDYIKSTNSEETFIEKLINADLNELLCEASCTTNTTLLQLTFKCFSKFIKCHAFFEHHHTVYTFETLLRCLHVLTKIDLERDSLICGLQLVSDIISRLKSYYQIPLNNVCDISNLLNLTSTLFKNETDHRVIYAATQVVLTILQSGDLAQVEAAARGVVSTCLTSYSPLVGDRNNKVAIAFIGQIVNASIRFLVRKDGEQRTEAVNDDNNKELLEQLHSTLTEVIAPYLIDNKSCYDDKELMQIIFSSLLSPYYFPEEKGTREFSNFLVCAGYLDFLPIIESQENDPELITAIRSLLFELLVCLSHQYLGEERWKCLIIPGLEALPVGTPYNSILLNESNAALSVASIVYNYFFLLSTTSPNVDMNFLRDLSRLIILLQEMPTFPIMKALWFTYCVAYLCHAEDYKESRISLIKVINFVMNTEVSSVYTHHPAILYWAFSGHGIPNELQAEIVLLWLERDDSKSTSILKSLLTVNRESLFLTMDLLAECGRERSILINNILSSNLPECENLAELYQHAWSALPTLLAKYSSNPEIPIYESLSYFIKYCCDYVPLTLDQPVVMRISCLLPSAFSNYCRIAFCNKSKEKLELSEDEARVVINNFNLINILLHIGMRTTDKRVSASFLCHGALLNSIELFTAANDEKVIVATMLLLMCFIHCQKKTRQKSSKVIQVDGMKILKFLQGKAEVCTTVLKFLTSYFEVLSENAESCIINIPQPTGIQLRSLYLHIHMICAKADDETASCCWLCLRKLLEFSESMGLKGYLAALPYTPSLLLKASEPGAWKEAMSFLSVWLKAIPHHTPQALSPTLSFQAVQQLTCRLNKTTNGKQLIDKMKKVFLAEKDKEPQMLTISSNK